MVSDEKPPGNGPDSGASASDSEQLNLFKEILSRSAAAPAAGSRPPLPAATRSVGFRRGLNPGTSPGAPAPIPASPAPAPAAATQYIPVTQRPVEPAPEIPSVPPSEPVTFAAPAPAPAPEPLPEPEPLPVPKLAPEPVPMPAATEPEVMAEPPAPAPRRTGRSSLGSRAAARGAAPAEPAASGPARGAADYAGNIHRQRKEQEVTHTILGSLGAILITGLLLVAGLAGFGAWVLSNELKAQKVTASQMRDELTGRISGLEERAKTAELGLSETQQLLGSTVQRLGSTEAGLVESQKALVDLRQQAAAELTNLDGAVKELRSAITTLRREAESASKEVNGRLSVAETRGTRAEARAAAMESRLATAEARLAKLREIIALPEGP